MPCHWPVPFLLLVSKIVYIDRLDNAVDKYNDAYHKTIKTKPLYIKSSTYIKYDVDENDKDYKFKVHHRTISRSI